VTVVNVVVAVFVFIIVIGCQRRILKQGKNFQFIVVFYPATPYIRAVFY
jgi:hypothetical protein